MQAEDITVKLPRQRPSRGPVSDAFHFEVVLAMIEDYKGARMPERVQDLLFHEWERDAVRAVLDLGKDHSVGLALYKAGAARMRGAK